MPSAGAMTDIAGRALCCVVVLALLSLPSAGVVGARTASADRPNIVVVYIDDVPPHQQP